MPSSYQLDEDKSHHVLIPACHQPLFDFDVKRCFAACCAAWQGAAIVALPPVGIFLAHAVNAIVHLGSPAVHAI
jgi:hypothetical protein